MVDGLSWDGGKPGQSRQFHREILCKTTATWKVTANHSYIPTGFFFLFRHQCDLNRRAYRPDIFGTYRYWARKYESRPTDRNSLYIWIPIFCFCQKLKLVFRSPQMRLYLNLQQEAAIDLYWFSTTELRTSIFSDIWLVARIVLT